MPSLRRDKQQVIDNQKDVTGLNVTPEFKAFVAGKLSAIIEQ